MEEQYCDHIMGEKCYLYVFHQRADKVAKRLVKGVMEREGGRERLTKEKKRRDKSKVGEKEVRQEGGKKEVRKVARG